MLNNKIIQQTIEEFPSSDREILQKLTITDLIDTFEKTKDAFGQFHKNIIEQADLNDMEKKIVAYFFAVTFKQHLMIVASAGKADTLSTEIIRDAYIQVLHQRVLIAVKLFLEKNYFPQRIKGLISSQNFMQKMHDHVSKCYSQRPEAKRSLKHQYKNKAFYEKNIHIYVQKHIRTTSSVLDEHRKQVLAKILEQEHTEGDIINFFVHEALHFCNPIKHNSMSELFFLTSMTDLLQASHIQASHRERLGKKDLSKQKKVRKPYKKKIEEVKQQDIHATEKSDKKQAFEEVFTVFEKNIQSKIRIILKNIKSYVLRCYLNDVPLRMKNIFDALGERYDNEIVNYVRDLCNKLNINIVELEDFVQQAKNIIQSDSLQKKAQSSQEENIQYIEPSPTLAQIQRNPEKLTTQVLIKICEELGYRFWDKKEFSTYANKLGLEKEGKLAITIKKKLIDYLIKQENDVWISEGSKETKNYEKLTFNDGSRMVKQKKTILWLTDHETYERLIQKHFTTNKTDFDKLLQYQTQSSENIDPGCM